MEPRIVDIIISTSVLVFLTGGLISIIVYLKEFLYWVLEDYKVTKDQLLKALLPKETSVTTSNCKASLQDTEDIIALVLKRNLSYNHLDADQLARQWSSSIYNEYINNTT